MSQPILRVVRGRDAVRSSDVTSSRSFDEFFGEESGTLFRRLWLVTRDRQEAEDVMQDAFLTVFERWDRIATMEDPTGYLYRTAFNVWKKRSRRAARAMRLAFASDPPPDRFAAAEARTVIGDALTRLTPRQRAALVLTELLGYSSEDAGAILGVRAVTARVLASQARAAMRADLGASHG
jgi:RNA polymerase sigma factor (sigma-70 family)